MAGVLHFDDGGNEFVSWQVAYFLMAAVMSICDIRLY